MPQVPKQTGRQFARPQPEPKPRAVPPGSPEDAARQANERVAGERAEGREYPDAAPPQAGALGALADVWKVVATDIVRDLADSLIGHLGLTREVMGDALRELADEFGGAQ